MTGREQEDRLFNRIVVYGLSLAFGLVVASSQALQPTPHGFAIVLSGWSLVALAVGAAITFPCFRIIVHSRRKSLRVPALCFVVLLGLGAFFYPMRVVPPENFHPVLVGLAVAVVALSILAGLLFLLHRFFEREETDQG